MPFGVLVPGRVPGGDIARRRSSVSDWAPVGDIARVPFNVGGGAGWPDGEGVVDDLRAKLVVLPFGLGGATLLDSGYLICSRKTAESQWVMQVKIML